ncbi:MAG TPA: hypothetical protein VJP88_05360 [Caulobacteraceae bacterium]|nr:hypothetical protein [Caulobacteraceae bacterium]
MSASGASARPKAAITAMARLRKEIETALSGGAEPADLVLKLTHSDASRLLRDPETPVSDVRFDAGVMRFLGVQVQKGGVETSALVVLSGGAAGPEPTL